MAQYRTTIDRAKEEMEKAWGKSDEDGDDIQELVKQDVLELLEVFSKQGHSGMSASYVLGVFMRLANHKPLTPLTGEDDEWWEPNQNDPEKLQQNKRYSAVFRKNFDNSTAYNIDGRVFIDSDGYPYTCRESRVPVTFPYAVPDKPEYVHTATH